MIQRVPIQDLAQINPRLSESEKPHARDLVSFVPMAAVSEETVSIVAPVDRAYREVSKGYTSFRRGDVLIAKITPCFENGKMAYANDLPRQVGFGSTEFHVIRPQPTLDGAYLFHLLREPFVRQAGASRMKGAAGQRRVPADFLADLTIPFPPLADQKRIAAILDAADALRTKRRESIEQLDTLIQSVFLDMFGDPVTNPKGWEVVPFGDLCPGGLRNGLSPSSKGRVPGEVLTLSAITGGAFDGSYSKEAVFDKEPSIDQFASAETFLVCRGNGNPELVGAGVFPTPGFDHVCFPDTIIGATVDFDRVVPAFLQCIWSSRLIRNQVASGARTTNGTYKINQALLQSIDLPLPSVNTQRQFHDVAAAVTAQRGCYSCHLQELDTLFASLQSRAFNGEL